MYFKLLSVSALVCFGFNLFAQLSPNQHAALVIDTTQHCDGNLCWRQKIPVEKVQLLRHYIVAMKADAGVQNADGNSPIHYAAAAGDTKFIVYLVCTRKVDVNSRNHNGVTPFMTAAMFGQTQAMELLHALNANIDATDWRRQYTALHWVVKAQKEHCIPVLWRLGAHMNPLDRRGDSPLNLASEMTNYGNSEARTLVFYGGQMNRPASCLAWWSEQSPLTLNISHTLWEESRSREPDLFLPLRISSCNHNGRAFLENFLTHPAHRNTDINRYHSERNSRQTLLFSAVSFGNIPCVMLLLERDANPMDRGYFRLCSSLMLANRMPAFHLLNHLTGRTFYQEMFRAAVRYLYVTLSPLIDQGHSLSLIREIVFSIAFMTVSVHIPEAERRL